MMRGLLVLFIFASTILFPWPLAAALAIVTSLFIPLLPLAVGIFADALYYAPHAANLPLFTLFGAVATCVALLVRSRLRASSITG